MRKLCSKRKDFWRRWDEE